MRSSTSGVFHLLLVILAFMALAFRRITCAPLVRFRGRRAGRRADRNHRRETAPARARLLRVAAGLEQPTAGSVETSGPARMLGPDDALNLAPAAVLLLDQTLARQDLLVRERSAIALDRLRRSGDDRAAGIARRGSGAPPRGRSLVAARGPPGGSRRPGRNARRLPASRGRRDCAPGAKP